MKVLMLNHFPLAGSGSGTYTQNIATHLAEKGHEVCIILPENTKNFDTPPGIQVLPVYFTNEDGSEPIEGALPFNFPCFTTHPRSTQTFYDLTDAQLQDYIGAFEAATQEAMQTFQPDLIHAQHVWILAWVAMRTGLPYVVTCHGTDIMGYQKGPRFHQYAEEAAAGAQQIISISKDNVSLVEEYFPESASKVVLMKNGYDEGLFHPSGVPREEVFAEFKVPPAPHLVFFSGKLAHFKGVDVLLSAAALYEKEYPGEIVTVLAGAGELDAQLKAQARREGLQHVHFIGFVPIKRLHLLYGAADVTVVPSRREPFGLVAIEALACGSPVVATNQGGLADIIKPEVGELVDVDDPDALAAAIGREVFNPNREQRGQRAALFAKEYYSQATIIDSLIGIYNSVV